MRRLDWFLLGGLCAWTAVGLMIGADIAPILLGVGIGLMAASILGVVG